MPNKNETQNGINTAQTNKANVSPYTEDLAGFDEPLTAKDLRDGTFASTITPTLVAASKLKLNSDLYQN